MFDINKVVRDNVKTLIPYSCARDEFKGKTGIFMDANESPYGKLNRYPDPYQNDLKASVSRIKGIPEENIFLGNGSDEIIDLSYRVFCKPGVDKALTFFPSYGMYEVSAAINDVRLIRIPLNTDFQIDTGELDPCLKDPELKLIFICSPNNPTSNAMDSSKMEYIISNFSGMVLIDEAYIDFSGTQSFKNKIGKYPNLIVMQTFSKAFGLAAVRVGMAFTNPDIVQYFNKMKPPYNISIINQKAVQKKLMQFEEVNKQVDKIKHERERLTQNLQKLTIIEKVFPSDANFLLVRTKNADLIYNKLVKEKIIVRNRSKIVQGCIRITIGKRKENNKLIKNLKKIKL